MLSFRPAFPSSSFRSSPMLPSQAKRVCSHFLGLLPFSHFKGAAKL
jgi:hypothetical protein